MVSYLTALWWRGDPDEKDQISGMSRRDIYNVQKSWNSINSRAHDNGFLVFTRLFEADAESKALFKFAAKSTVADLAQSVVFRAHIVNVMSSLDSVVQQLRDPAVAAQVLRNLGDTHHQRKVQRKHFQVFREVLTHILETDLALSSEVLASWGRFVDFMYQNIFDTLTD